MHITAFYAALLGLLLIALAARVSLNRRASHTSLGDGGHDRLTKAIRAHGNFIEYVPMALILMAFLEVDQTAHWVLHIFGVALVLGRIMHGIGIMSDKAVNAGRFYGSALTWLVILVASLLILWRLLLRFVIAG